MKLEKYVDKDKKRRKVILISISIIVLISASFLLYKTFASFTENVEFPMMKGKVDYFGNSDVYFVFYVNDELVDEMPQKGNEDGILYEHGECDNGASIVFDYVEWAPLVKNLSSRKTKCSLYFSEKGPGEYYANKVVECSKNNNGANCLMENADYDTLNLAYDKTSDNNLRYIGNNPNNYVKFNDEVWRIVGVMNNIEDENGVSESRIKLVNPNSIGSYLWDNKAKGERSSLSNDGSNSWVDSTLKNVLNSGAYWNRTSGECPSERLNVNEPCNFSSNGLKDEAKLYIGNAIWNIGAVNSDTTLMKDFYEFERSNKVCNTDYPAKWIGKVGLIYSSDYTYAVGSDGRNTCINIDKTNWTTEEYSFCKENDWLYPKNYDGYWTITPRDEHSSGIYRITAAGGFGWRTVGTSKNEVLPSVYLKSNVKITGGNGSIDNPYEITTNEEIAPKTKSIGGVEITVVESGDGLYMVSHANISGTTNDDGFNQDEFRYAGTNPNNYVEFNNEVWRIIGLVNVKTESGIEQRLKIVRFGGLSGQKDFGSHGWDYKSPGTGSSVDSHGSNDWTDSQLKDTLNGIYYESTSGDCWTGTNDEISSQTTCDFSTGESLSKGLNEAARQMIDKDVIWNLGGWNTHSFKASLFYEKERGTSVYIGNNVTRPTLWSKETDVGGKFNGIGLIYPSDYIFSTNGGMVGKENCLNEEIYNWGKTDFGYTKECVNNDWLKPNDTLWTIMPRSSNDNDVAFIDKAGYVRIDIQTNNARLVWPTVYLKSSIKIESDSSNNYGSIDNPFRLTT